MNPVLRNVLAVVAGIVVGMAVNFGLVMLGVSMVPPPEGVSVMDPESIKANMHLFEVRHFVFPFLAHALGTLAGAFVAARLAANNNLKFALGIGAFFLIGGFINANSIGLPTWFMALDLILAYIPMGWLGGKLARA